MRVDLVSLASGAVIAALGALVLLDSSGAIDLSLGSIAVALTAAVGAILLLSGLVDGAERHH
jgi:membrane associated rhomboid family serine protease